MTTSQTGKGGTGSLKRIAAQNPQASAQAGPQGSSLYHFSTGVHRKLLERYGSLPDLNRVPQIRAAIDQALAQVLEEEQWTLGTRDRAFLLEYVVHDLLGYGPLEPLLNDDTISEIMVNGPRQVFVERNGLLEEVNTVFENDDHLMRIVNRIVLPLGRHLNDTSPMVNARLPAGFRVNVIIPPLAVDGPTMTIRKFARTPFTVQDLVNMEALTAQAAGFLKACVEARVNIVVSGGTGAGKTTLLNVMSAFIPPTERIVTIEDTAELQLSQKHVVRLEARPPDVSERNEVTIRQLLINALRMRPDRIVIGEARGGEALDMLQAMNTGHDGSLTTVHSNSPRDTLRRIELMALMAGIDLPLRAIREQVASAIQMIVHMERLRDGSRRIVRVSEVGGMEGDTITMTDLYLFEGRGEGRGPIQGVLKPTGLRPKFVSKFALHGVELQPSFFAPMAL